jgi:hypothetical protein
MHPINSVSTFLNRQAKGKLPLRWFSIASLTLIASAVLYTQHHTNTPSVALKPPAPTKHWKWTYQEEKQDAILNLDRVQIMIKDAIPLAKVGAMELDWSGYRVPQSCLPEVQVAGNGRQSGKVKFNGNHTYFSWDYHDGVGSFDFSKKRFTIQQDGKILRFGALNLNLNRRKAIILQGDGSVSVKDFPATKTIALGTH